MEGMTMDNLYKLRGFVMALVGATGVIGIEIISLLMQPEPPTGAVFPPMHGVSPEGAMALTGILTAYWGWSQQKHRASVKADAAIAIARAAQP
jgi:hypothetical protein